MRGPFRRATAIACGPLLAILGVGCAAPGPDADPVAGGGPAGPAGGGAAALTVGSTPTRARAAGGDFISWREHRIDDEELGGVAIRGSDGLWMADFDRDGHLDIASVHESDTEYDGVADGHVRLAFGSGTAAPKRWELRTVAEGEAAGAPEDVVAADVDGDGWLDLVVGCELGHVLYLENPGADARTGKWSQLIVPGTPGRGSFIRVAAADFDGDGRPEVAAANKGEQNPGAEGRTARPISWFSIEGDPLDPGSWVEHELARVDWPINVETVDLDGDGDLDLFAGSRGELRVMWFENEGRSPPAFIRHDIAIAGSTVPRERRPPQWGDPERGLAAGFNVAFADLDGDDRLDLVLREGDFLVWLAQPTDPAQPWPLHPIGSMKPDNLVGLVVADIDGDGDHDAFAGAYSRGPRDRDGEVGVDDELGGLAWFENPGDAAAAWTRHDVSRRRRGMYDELVARDMDGDGDVDFVTTRGNSAPWDGVLWLEQVRTAEPLASFAAARAEDSEEMARPETQAAAPAPATAANSSQGGAERTALFGDLHVHTRLSYDAFIFGTRATPEDAYRYARGEAITHPAGFEVKLSTPLDFCAVTDHATFMGMLEAMNDPSQEASNHPVARRIAGARTPEERRAAFQEMLAFARGEREGLLDPAVVRSAWQRVIEAAERHNEPGRLSTFIGYEYTGSPEGQNLHRNVIFRGSKVPEIPFSRLESMNPEDLWAWMDRHRESGIEALAIPHNSNGSNGQMFRLESFEGEPLDAAYAETRMRNEPLVEITQIKGTSETHPALSPNDEWAGFEIYPYIIATTRESKVSGSYVREAWLNGLVLEEERGWNPFRFGVVGASDTHNAAATPDESSYFSASGQTDAAPRDRGSVPLEEPGSEGSRYAASGNIYFGASGLAAVWAEENTRASIYDAFRRKETFATSGPRIRLRFFGGYDYADGLDRDPAMIAGAYAGGVPMGGDLPAVRDRAPRFLVWASRDPSTAPLQRLQIVKGWVERGEPRERVYDVACSDGLAADPATHRCPDNGARVDLQDCSITADRGAGELRTLWTDPDFTPGTRAFYYARALENPTCRWSTWDAIRAGVEPRPDLEPTLQERAWSSPIWVAP